MAALPWQPAAPIGFHGPVGLEFNLNKKNTNDFFIDSSSTGAVLPNCDNFEIFRRCHDDRTVDF
jgi:hypothetical protein